MPGFKEGMHVVSMPNKIPCVIKRIDPDATYPIEVYELTGTLEGTYTLEGFRYKDTSPETRKFFIAMNYPISSAKPNTNYWTIVRANSAFIQLSHPELQDILMPISTIERIDLLNNEPVLISSSYKLSLGPVPIQSVADILFANETNSI